MPLRLTLDASLDFCFIEHAILTPPRTHVYVLMCILLAALLILYVTAVCLIVLISAVISTQQSCALFCLLVVESLPCELLWLRLYLDIFLPTHFQGWLLNKKMKWRAKSLCKRGEQRGKGREERKPIGWAAACDLTTAWVVRLRRRQWRT